MAYPTLNWLFEEAVNHHRERPAIIELQYDGLEQQSVTYQELGDLVDGLVYALDEMEIGRDTKVAVLAKPRVEWAVSFFATLKLGGGVVPIDPNLQEPEVKRILHNSETKVAIVDGEHLTMLESLIDSLEMLEYVVAMDAWEGFDFPYLHDLIGERRISVDEEVSPDDLAALIYTSGTTGNAKGAMLTHANLSSNIESVIQVMHVAPDDTLVSIAPWNHIFGLTVTLLIPIRMGATTTYTDQYKELPAIMHQTGATILIGVPKLYHTMFDLVMRQVNSSWLARNLYKYKLSSRLVGQQVKKKLVGDRFRFLVSGGAPLDPMVADGLKRFGIGIIEGYGLTETSPVVCFNEAFSEKSGSVGRSIPGVEIKIVNPDEQGIGVIAVRGPNVMQGYYKNPQATQVVLDEQGWLHTGDLGYLDEQGYLYIKGREKNLIVLETGKNVYPEEVESELEQIPYIEEILVRQRMRGGKETVQALVYPNWERLDPSSDSEKVKQLIWEEIKKRNWNLAAYKRIKTDQDLIIVDQPFEKTTTLKIKRHSIESEPNDAPGSL
ncbi:MAG: AMP-dependent synthetase/ligase [Candidatus Bipolaricaulia bacterium]